MFFVAFVHVRSHPFTVFLWSICGPFANRYIERSLRAREGLCPPAWPQQRGWGGRSARWLNRTHPSYRAGRKRRHGGRVVKQLVRESETLRIALVRNDQAASAQTQQVAACNALHELEERLSRWLLQTRDLLRSDTLPLTQEFLSQMLGVQRSSVTLVARKLQEAGLINYRRGRIHVLDVEGLQDSCCECYEAINAHFQRLIGWSPNGDNQAQRTAD